MYRIYGRDAVCLSCPHKNNNNSQCQKCDDFIEYSMLPIVKNHLKEPDLLEKK